MPSARIFQLSLDAKTRKIIRQIPKGFRSQKIREWIAAGAEGENFDISVGAKNKKVDGDKAITRQLRRLRE